MNFYLKYRYKHKKISPNMWFGVVPRHMSAHYCSNGTSTPRAAILIHKNLENHSRELKQFTTPDQVAIHIKHKDKEIIFASTYMDITHGP